MARSRAAVVSVSAFAAVVTLVAGAVAAATYQAVSAVFALAMAGAVLVEGVVVAMIGERISRRAARVSAVRERRRRDTLPPLPGEWTVPDYPPPDLNS